MHGACVGRYSLQVQQSMHLPQHEPAVAGQPQLHGQHSLPQQQVDCAGVADVVVMMISVMGMWTVQRHGGVRRRTRMQQQLAAPRVHRRAR